MEKKLQNALKVRTPYLCVHMYVYTVHVCLSLSVHTYIRTYLCTYIIVSASLPNNIMFMPWADHVRIYIRT